MSLFSERYGYTEKPLQSECISEELRNRIWNTYRWKIFYDSGTRMLNYLPEIMDACGLAFENINTNADIDKNIKIFHTWLMEAKWYKIYDFIEIYLDYLMPKDQKQARDDFNALFKAENAGYRIIDNQVIPITNEDELKCIEQAQLTIYESVNKHFHKAVEQFSKRPTPDYENSIKESISAVEALCSIITGITGKGATLGNTIKYLKDKGIHIHPAMESAFSSLYGYTNDENGIRHGGMDFKDAPIEDAKYMLVSCSAFVNYLMEKWSKVSST